MNWLCRYLHTLNVRTTRVMERRQMGHVSTMPAQSVQHAVWPHSKKTVPILLARQMTHRSGSVVVSTSIGSLAGRNGPAEGAGGAGGAGAGLRDPSTSPSRFLLSLDGWMRNFRRRSCLYFQENSIAKSVSRKPSSMILASKRTSPASTIDSSWYCTLSADIACRRHFTILSYGII